MKKTRPIGYQRTFMSTAELAEIFGVLPASIRTAVWRKKSFLRMRMPARRPLPLVAAAAWVLVLIALVQHPPFWRPLAVIGWVVLGGPLMFAAELVTESLIVMLYVTLRTMIVGPSNRAHEGSE